MIDGTGGSDVFMDLPKKIPGQEAKDINKIPDINKLNQWAIDAESADKATFAEMRSNLLLIAGDHYSRLNERVYDRIRSARDLTNEIKIRLTKNHTGKIHKTYVNNIMMYAPGVFVGPKNESELSDQKAAELANAVWQDGKDKLSYTDWIADWADDFCGISEVWTKLYFDPNGGPLKGYAQAEDELGQPQFEKKQQPKVDPLTGMPTGELEEVDDESKPVADKEQPIFYGELKFEEVFGFNVFRAAEAKSLKESPWLMIRKMVSVEKLKKMFPKEAQTKMISETADKTFLVFDNAQGGYRKSDKNECLIREFYMKPCPEYPEGYYWITTETGILDQDVLPFGIFPIEGELFDKIQTSPRGRGIVKQIRPYQIEINRCASKIAEHQMTLGDDKLIMFNGSEMSSGGQVPGVRGIKVKGAMAPTVLPGRSGSQFLEYMQSQIVEMYQVAMVDEDSKADVNGQLDPYALLFKSASQRKVYKRHIQRFENFLIRVCKLYLKMAKVYLPEDTIILAIGKKERINIAEFKNSNDLSTEITVEPRTDDVETLMGKQLVMNHLIQYTGNQLTREDIGKLIKQMPYANVDESFSDLTMDYENATNLLLALDRGETPEISQIGPQEYIVSRLDHRMQQADFNYLDQFIKMNYQKQKAARLQMIEQMKQQAQRDAAGLIPATGALIDAGAWIPDPQNPGKTIRLRLPQDSVYWLFQKLQDQGYMQAQLNKMSAEENYLRSVGGTGQPPQGQQQPMPQQQPMSPMNNGNPQG